MLAKAIRFVFTSMKTLCTILLLALLTPVITAQESSSPAVGELGANARFKQDDYAANVAARNVEEHPEHDMQGLTGAMKSQQDAGMAAAENVASHEEHDMQGLTGAMKSQQDAGMAAAENVASHEEHDMQGLTGAMKSQQDAGMAAAENVLENDSFDNSGISKAGKQPYLCSDSSIENTVSALEAPSKRFLPMRHRCTTMQGCCELMYPQRRHRNGSFGSTLHSLSMVSFFKVILHGARLQCQVVTYATHALSQSSPWALSLLRYLNKWTMMRLSVSHRKYRISSSWTHL
jgi:hypothetical protein